VSESEFVRHEACPNCGSHDNLARYSDGHGFCFGCGHCDRCDNHAGSPGVGHRRPVALIEPGEARPLLKRGISQRTAEKFGYTVSTYKGKTVQIEPHYNYDGQLVAQHIRFPPGTKDERGNDLRFIWLGNPKDAMMFGQQLWKAGGKRVVVAEGAVDALSVSELQGNKWPVVSISIGAAKPEHTKKIANYISKHVAWLEKFDEVVFAFDMDEAGRASAQAAAKVLSPGTARIASYPLKDANDMLLANRGKELIDSLWQAKEFRPDGLLRVADIIERALEPPSYGTAFPWPSLTSLTYGRQTGKVYAWGAGTGTGKTDILMQIVAHSMEHTDERIGLFMFENDPAETLRYVASKIDAKLYTHPGADWSQEELVSRLHTLSEQDRLMIYDNWGTTDWDEVRGHIRYLAKSWNMTGAVIDHITAFSARADDERREIERLMADIAMLAQELKIVIDVVSHLATPIGTSHEEGGRVTIRHFKGSRSIGFWSHVIFGLERDQQAEELDERRTTLVRILKCRPRGSSVGSIVPIRYDVETGMYTEVLDNPFMSVDAEDDNEPF